jgi:hypothetical protein
MLASRDIFSTVSRKIHLCLGRSDEKVCRIAAEPKASRSGEKAFLKYTHQELQLALK